MHRLFKCGKCGWTGRDLPFDFLPFGEFGGGQFLGALRQDNIHTCAGGENYGRTRHKDATIELGSDNRHGNTMIVGADTRRRPKANWRGDAFTIVPQSC
jgi:hypothetical protein